MLEKLPLWEVIQKKMVFLQLGNIQQLRILDFGSGLGVVANYYAEHNDVVAVEPSEKLLRDRFSENDYLQIHGDINAVKQFADSSFDMVFCHNVLEYVPDRLEILREFYRVLKPGGILSVVKHNRPERSMQIKALRNEFEAAKAYIEASDHYAEQYGTLHYYSDSDLTNWCDCLKIVNVFGIHAFFDPQQSKDQSADIALQEAIFELEIRASQVDVHRNTALFHHLIIRKEH